MSFSNNGQWANGSGAWNQSNPYTSGGAIPLDNTFFSYKNDSALSDTNGRAGYCGFWFASAGGGTSAKLVAIICLILVRTVHLQEVIQQFKVEIKTSFGVGDFKYPVPDGASGIM